MEGKLKEIIVIEKLAGEIMKLLNVDDSKQKHISIQRQVPTPQTHPRQYMRERLSCRTLMKDIKILFTETIALTKPIVTKKENKRDFVIAIQCLICQQSSKAGACCTLSRYRLEEHEEARQQTTRSRIVSSDTLWTGEESENYTAIKANKVSHVDYFQFGSRCIKG
ncbi:unnamed protein product [Mytilus edulis]|uniref:Uncharacterized protein n=1 Tax=Mytilus edulis TaxID=6550 RepID=A0A8S3RU47_MYTED|nr:unnamed protein product [Mytilus edulis]